MRLECGISDLRPNFRAEEPPTRKRPTDDTQSKICRTTTRAPRREKAGKETGGRLAMAMPCSVEIPSSSSVTPTQALKGGKEDGASTPSHWLTTLQLLIRTVYGGRGGTLRRLGVPWPGRCMFDVLDVCPNFGRSREKRLETWNYLPNSNISNYAPSCARGTYCLNHASTVCRPLMYYT